MKYSGKKQKGSPIRSLLLLTQPSVAILAIMVVLMQWRIPSPVSITLWTELPQATEFEELVKEIHSGHLLLSRIHRLEVHYPTFPNMRPAKFTEVDRIELASIGGIHATGLDRNSPTQEIRWGLEGKVSRFSIRSKAVRRDLRMTRFDVLLHTRWALYALLAGWIFFTAFGWFKLYQELNRGA